jgi:hypothetical protein
MKHLTSEEAEKLYEQLTPPVIEALESEKTSSIVEDIGSRNHLDRERLDVVRYLTASVLLGTLQPGELVSEITSKAKVDGRVATSVSDELHKKILAPLAGDLSKIHGYHIEGLPQPAKSAASDQPPPTDTSNPTASPPVPSPQGDPSHSSRPESKPPEPEAQAPLIIHDHPSSDRIGADRGDANDGSLVRPTFYTPANTSANAPPPPRARLEIGGEAAQSGPPTMRVGKEQAKIVHYTAPEAPQDPFSPAPQEASDLKASEGKPVPGQGQKDVSPDNVVDLKDLPK